jgi:hypothetical protein
MVGNLSVGQYIHENKTYDGIYTYFIASCYICYGNSRIVMSLIESNDCSMIV